MTQDDFQELHTVRHRLERLTFERTYRAWSERQARNYVRLATRELELIRAGATSGLENHA
jgi:hypothetical protein